MREAKQQHNWKHRHARRLLRMMRGASMADWLWFIDFARLRDQVYVYDHACHSVYTPGGGEVEWPIVWVLARYHKKHILCTKALPRIDQVVRDLNDWGNRLKWQWFHRKDSDSKPSITVRYRRLPTCTHLLAPEVEWMVRNMKDCVLRECRRAISKVRYDRSYANVLPLTSFGLSLLRRSGLKAIPNDKDGGYALETVADYRMVHSEILDNGVYEEIPNHMVKVELDNARTAYSSLCLLIAKQCGEPQLARELRKSLQQGRLIATLKPTCKSHKPNGSVSHRPVHALPDYAFAGSSKWISQVLMDDLRGRRYLVKDTAQFIRSISQFTAKQDHFFIKLDIKDYFLSGCSQELCNASASVVPADVRPLFTTVLMNLLHYQFVESRELCERCWRATRGTGMGLPHSGEVADSAFATLAEDPWATDPDTQARHSIEGYWRFKDDILILGSRRQHAKEFFWKMRELAAFFKVQCEAWNADEIQFLEVIVRKNVDKGCFETMPKQRDSNISKPLDISSAHPGHVHRSWPHALMQRARALTNTARGMAEAMNDLKRRFLDNFADPQFLQPCSSLKKHVASNPGGITWITFGFHPALQSSIKRGVQKCVQGPFSGLYSWSFGVKPNVRVAWSNRLRSIASYVSNL